MSPQDSRRGQADREDLSINNTVFRRLLTLVALRTTARLYKRSGVCVPISGGLLVKSDAFVDLTEAATIRFIAERTTIPVPKVYCSFLHNGRAFIVIERIRGEPIANGWDERSEESKVHLVSRLRDIFRELRRLEPPNDAGVRSCVGGSLLDSRMPRPDHRFGPFETVQEFHSWLRAGLRTDGARDGGISEDDWRGIKAMAAKQDGPWPPPVFTHADVSPSNILVRGDDVVGIIDWEFSGWYPHYWEYTSAWTGSHSSVWRDLLPRFLDAHPEELEMETTRQRFWGGH